jgi:hypothetical protein
VTVKTFTKESLCDTHKERFLSMHDKFPFGCSPYKGQSLCMWVILTQKDVSFSLWYMSCVNCVCFGWCAILIYIIYFCVRKIYWRNNFHKFGLRWPNPLNYTGWDFLILGWNPTPIDLVVGFIYDQRKKTKQQKYIPMPHSCLALLYPS